jgi:hypothetical protein
MSTAKRIQQSGTAGARATRADDPSSFVLLVEAAVKELEGTALARSITRVGDKGKVFDEMVKVAWALALRNEVDLVTLAVLYLRLSVLVFSFGDEICRDAQFTGGPR